MEKLRAVGSATNEWSKANTVVEWRVRHESAPMCGQQSRGSGSEPTTTASAFAWGPGLLFDLHVPPVVRLGAVADSRALTRSWNSYHDQAQDKKTGRAS